MSDEKSPWICHVCGYRSNFGEGHVCSECYRITCKDHITRITVLNQETNLYEIRPLCIACRLQHQL